MTWKGHFSLLVVLLSPYLIAGSPTPPSSDFSNRGLHIETSSGQVHGFINETAPSVRQFLGVPFAEPPLGELRFEPPLPIKRRSKPIDATTWAASCIQQLSTSASVFTEVVQQFLINGGQSEDCLYLNIWAPLPENIPKGEKLPVFFYVPGGGFTGGGADSMYKVPDKWIQRTQTHIVVVLNYRLNVFGFPNAPGLNHPNVGLLDQRAAIEWTQQNIEAFGGDPSRITLWGQSAGAAAVSAYGYAYPEDPIVTGLISDSGIANFIYSLDYQHTNFTTLARLVGYKSGQDEGIVEYMRQIPATTLQNAIYEYTFNGTKPAFNFIPLVDNVTFFDDLTDRANRGLLADIPSIIGNNANEGEAFGTFSWQGPNQTSAAALTLNSFTCPASAEVRNRATHGCTTYQYYYTGNFSNISPLSWMGAYHSSELPLIFGTHYEFRGNSTEFEWELSEVFEDIWLSFASNPDQAPGYERTRSDGKSVKWSWPAATADRDSSKIVQWPYGQEYLKEVDSSSITAACL